MVRGLLFILFLTALAAAAQNSAPLTWESTPILRLQQKEFSSNACVLLRRNGAYHLEQAHRRSTRVYEGTLSKEQLAEVNRWLVDPVLLRFSQKDIVVPLISRNDDQVQINILRMDHWQWMEFPDAESRKPLEAALTPLLAWLKDLHNLPARTLSEDEGKNNCLPPGQIELKRRPELKTREKSTEAAPTAPVVAPPERSYLLRFERDRFGPGTAQRMCLIVYPAGSYHAENAAQSTRTQMDVQVYEDKLSPEQLAAIGSLLDDPELRKLQHGNLPQDAQSSDITTLSIPRSDSTQQLRMAENFAVWQGARWITTSHDPEAKVADPIEQWVKNEFHFSKANRLKAGVANNCEAR